MSTLTTNDDLPNGQANVLVIAAANDNVTEDDGIAIRQEAPTFSSGSSGASNSDKIPTARRRKAMQSPLPTEVVDELDVLPTVRLEEVLLVGPLLEAALQRLAAQATNDR